jgi:hypothetical protein
MVAGCTPGVRTIASSVLFHSITGLGVLVFTVAMAPWSFGTITAAVAAALQSVTTRRARKSFLISTGDPSRLKSVRGSFRVDKAHEETSHAVDNWKTDRTFPVGRRILR